MTLEASVIVPTFNDWPVLQKCLDSLAVQSVGLDRFEVIVANNNATADVPGDLRLPPNATVIHAAKPGSYAARNAAMRQSKGQVLFFTDSDCQPDRLWIETGMSALAGLGPTARVAGPVELFPKGRSWTSYELFDRLNWFRLSRYVEEGWAVTANLATRRTTFDLVGTFNEDMFSGGDKEWGLRAFELGCPIVFRPDAIVRHPARDSYADIAQKSRRLLGALHQRETRTGVREKSTISYLVPKMASFRRVALDDQYSDYDKFFLMCLDVRVAVTLFIEIVRLRYLSGTPSRS